MMSRQSIYWIIGVSAFCALSLMFMQVNWIINAARLQEENFKHRVTMALRDVKKQLKRDSVACASIAAQLRALDPNADLVPVTQPQRIGLDSLLHYHFTFNEINTAYTFAIERNPSLREQSLSDEDGLAEGEAAPFRVCLDGTLAQEKGWNLSVYFPENQAMIFAGMKSMFLFSLGLIVMLLACFVLTVRTIFQQKKLSDMTTDFISNMTHELKTPLATISLAAKMLQKEKVQLQPERLNHYSSVIFDENYKLQGQVEKVLQLARLERGEIKLNKTTLSVHEVIESTVKGFALQVEEKGGQIDLHLDAKYDSIRADRTHLLNTVSNLLDNANKYAPDWPHIKVITSCTREGVTVAVEDNGIGMSKDKQKHVFDKFYRVATGNIHDVKGFGLGLAYVKMIVEAHKGEVRLQSEPGKGSRFEVFFPYDLEPTEKVRKWTKLGRQPKPAVA